MNWNEVRKKVIERGYTFSRHGSGHDLYVKGDRTVWLERHWSQEVRPGLLKKLKKEIGF